MDSFSHIAERFVLHFFSSTSLVMLLYFALRFILRKRPSRWISSDRLHLLLTSGLIVAAAASLREPFDVAAGQSVTKAVTDFISWYGGCGASVYGLYRLTSN